MRTNLPKEMDFVNEAHNAERTTQEFTNIRTSLYIPEVVIATKRVLIMEYIQGGRVDDLKYLADANIDRNKVALELSRIFNQMVFINGWFHAVCSYSQPQKIVLLISYITRIPTLVIYIAQPEIRSPDYASPYIEKEIYSYGQLLQPLNHPTISKSFSSIMVCILTWITSYESITASFGCR
jgi:hypothetical protein